MDILRFDGRVALVTGAGGGLGREYALLFAERGASVVVNDLGGDIKGGGKSQRAADKVVSEIRARGGKAVANYDSVEDGEKLVKTALENFGRIDILINNAGILRDRSFARTSDLDWDLVHRVHLRGAFKVTRAAWPHMKKQNYGRIICTTSSAGLYGNFGQANYSAAKLGLVGLSNTLAIEGAKYNIKCNVIAPFAGSRLTETVMTPDMVDALKPFYIAPVVVYLCHESCDENGSIIESGAGWYAKLRLQRSKGVVVRRKGIKFTPEEIRRTWDTATDFDEPSYPANIQEANAIMLQALDEYNQSEESTNNGQSTSGGGGFNPNKAIGYQFPPNTFSYTSKDAILYALGVGVSTRQPDHLKFLFELNDEFSVLPTYAVIPAQTATMSMFTSVPGLEDIDVTKILHGEQYLEVYRPLPSSATLTSVSTILDILDKGSGAVIVVGIETFDESKELVAYNQLIIFLVGAGNFGGKRNSDKIKPSVKTPTRTPDSSVKEVTSVDQAAIYRLSGDKNPLHLDPTFAAMGGFSQPILHGLCSFGYATRHVLKQYAGNDVSKFKSIKVRFSKPVLPGQTIQTNMWKEGNRILIQCQVAETGTVVLTDGCIELTDVSAGTTTEVPNEPENSGLQSEMIFIEMGKQLAQSPEQLKKVNGVFLYNITVGKKVAGQWTVVAKPPSGEVYKGEPKAGKADCTVTMGDKDFVGLVTGNLKPQEAFMSGKLKVKGNIMLLQKAAKLFEQYSKL